MNSSRPSSVWLISTSLLAASIGLATASAQDNPLRFQRPGEVGQASQASRQKFRAPSQLNAQEVRQASAGSAPVSAKKPVAKRVIAKPQAKNTVVQDSQRVAKVVRRDSRVDRAQSEEVEYESSAAETYEADTFEEGPIDTDSIQLNQPMRGRVMNEPSLEMGHPHMEMAPPHMEGCQCESCMGDGHHEVVGCGIYDPGCGMEAGCGIADPACGCAEPACGVPDCGSCVDVPGPDYWCFPVCLPRLKDLTIWGGVHGFRGPRDFIPAGQSNSNFGFQEGVNVSGRAPLVGFLFPELSYQLGYQAFQSRLSGTIDEADDRGTQFVTAGLFRRTQYGLQFGAVFDSMTDDLDEQIDLNQMRYEISLKTPRGRELGFWGASSTNDAISDGVTFEAVDQFCGFYRWNFKDGYQGRIWGGGTGDGEGILGADFYAPLNNRWSVQTGFNYLIPDQNSGPEGVVEESWNLGINLVWHLGRTARKGCRSPFRPLFPVADNGWMFVDQVD